jgi:hypothetical protein
MPRSVLLAVDVLPIKLLLGHLLPGEAAPRWDG